MKSREQLQNGAQQHKFVIKNCYFNIKNGNPRYCSVAFVIPFYVINCAIQRTCEPQRVAVGRPCRYRFTPLLEGLFIPKGEKQTPEGASC